MGLTLVGLLHWGQRFRVSGRNQLQQDMEHEAGTGSMGLGVGNCAEGLIQTELGVGSIVGDSYTRMARGSLSRAFRLNLSESPESCFSFILCSLATLSPQTRTMWGLGFWKATTELRMLWSCLLSPLVTAMVVPDICVHYMYIYISSITPPLRKTISHIGCIAFRDSTLIMENQTEDKMEMKCQLLFSIEDFGDLYRPESDSRSSACLR